MLDADATISDWVTLDSEEENSDEADIDANPTSTSSRRIIEAQGIVITPDGEIFLSAEVPTVTPQGEWIPSLDCNQLQKGME
jgi:large exoprotein involved in heme utilization and adhesion